MATKNAKFQMSVSFDDGTLGISGYDNEGGAVLINSDTTYSAGSSNVALSLAFTAANLQLCFLISDKGCTLTTNGATGADVQTISISGTPTGGSFGLGFGGQVTVIAYNAIASAVQTALQALSTIGSGNITCSGGPLPGTPVVCTFAGTLANGLQPLFTVYSGALTGGSSPTASVAHTTPGLPQDTIVLPAGIPRIWGKSQGYGSNPFAGPVTGGFVSCTPATRLQIRLLTT